MDKTDKKSFANRIRSGKTLTDFTTRMMNLKRRQSRYERPIYAFWELFSDMSEYSTIHGVRYMGEKVKFTELLHVYRCDSKRMWLVWEMKEN